MPLYGAVQSGSNLTSVEPGESYTLFNAETLTAPQSSIAFLRGYTPGAGQPAGIVFTVHFAAASPTATVAIQASNGDSDLLYQTVGSIVNVQNGYYADAGNFKYYRAQLVSQSSGGALTVIAQR